MIDELTKEESDRACCLYGEGWQTEAEARVIFRYRSNCMIGRPHSVPRVEIHNRSLHAGKIRRTLGDCRYSGMP